jgi:YD repeat-containing protein
VAQARINVCVELVEWCLRNEPRVVANGVTTMVPTLYERVPQEPRPAVPEDVVKRVLAACYKDIEETERKLELGRHLGKQGAQPGDDEQAQAVHQLLIATRGKIPGRRDLNSRQTLLVDAAGGLREVTRYLRLTAPQVFPFYLAILAQTGANPMALRKLRRDCVNPHPLVSHLERIVWDKPRAGKEQYVDFPAGKTWSAPSLVRRLVALNRTLVSAADSGDRQYLFLTQGTSASTATVLSWAYIHLLLDKFIAKHDLPSFDLAGFRTHVAKAHHVEAGSLIAAKERLNHAEVSTTVRYTPLGDRAAKHDQTMVAFQGRLVREARGEQSRWTSDGSVKKGGAHETLFGFRCSDPYEGRAPGSVAGKLCQQFQKCATCPGALIPLDDTRVVAKLLATSRHLEATGLRAKKEGWWERYCAVYLYNDQYFSTRYFSEHDAEANAAQQVVQEGCGGTGWSCGAGEPIPQGDWVCSPQNVCTRQYIFLFTRIYISPTDPSYNADYSQMWPSTVYRNSVAVMDYFHGKTPTPPNSCSVPSPNPAFGKPIYPLTGSKRREERLGVMLGGDLIIGYESKLMIPANDPSRVFSRQALPSFGGMWQSSLHKTLRLQSSAGAYTAQASRGLGKWISFNDTGSGYAADGDVADRLVATVSGFTYYDAASRSEELYDRTGLLYSVSFANGNALSYTYSSTSTPSAIAPVAGLLLTVTDSLGRKVSFTYQQPANAALAPQIVSMTAPDGNVTTFAYDQNGNLTNINFPDNSVRQFLYENAAFPWALTGVLDEQSHRINTYAYDTTGLAIDTQGAGGVEHYSATWSQPPSQWITQTIDDAHMVIRRDHYFVPPQGTVVTLPNGTSTSLETSAVQGAPYVTSQSQPAGSGCSASTSQRSYDTNGNLAWKEDFNGHRVCYANDLSRNLETARVEGLAAGSDCSSALAATTGLPTGSRKTSTAWHPDWRTATQVAEPRRITTSVYNGQPDPFNGGAVATCAPSNATLPDGKPIVVLCKQVEQATTDADGSAGLTASLDTSVPARVQQWTYNQYGQVLTAKDALNHTTTNTYYADTTAAHTLGDLATVTNALNQVVANYTQYNLAGQWLQMVDANGTTTTRSFDLRQRLKTSTTAGATTNYDYWPNGLLKAVTLPDASSVNYAYDDAQRLTGVTDNLGNSITYTLDNMGNRTAQTVKDPAGMLSRTLTQSFDALGRVQQTVGRQ